MKYFETQLINIIEKSQGGSFSLSGCTPEILLFLIDQLENTNTKTTLWFSPLQVRQNLSCFSNDKLFIWDKEFYDPTDQVLNHEAMLNLLCTLYDHLLFDNQKHCFVPWELAFFRLPDPHFF